MGEEVGSFSLKSGTDLFLSRSQDIFANLGALEDKHSAFLKATAASRRNDDLGIIKNDPDEDDEFVSGSHGRSKELEECRSRFHGKSQLNETRDADYEPRSHSRSPNRSIQTEAYTGRTNRRDNANEEFKRPGRLPQRLSRQPIPDHKKHPEKYTCYSLGDVLESDMSEKANQRAAFDFLEAQRHKREKQERELTGLSEEAKFDIATAACSQGKITFSHRKHQKKDISGETPTDRNIADIMTFQNSVDSASFDNDEDKNSNVVVADAETEDSGLSTPNTGSDVFKSRKNVRRHIRSRDKDNDSD